ncbi:hypothetical protein [Neomoorella thermoacetica]|uniref:hypothetical protein n=1 Tax=Neomoorella thermoacetica TaxID=1525 RepID=UPI0008FAFBDE|nr:hypothetical protein [Moorella thermoacetica]APC08285.1 hypothetical protein MTJW_11190 [Moorella thermoacetica]
MVKTSNLLLPWEKLAQEGKLAEAVIEYVKGYDYVSLAELTRNLQPYMETKGDFIWRIDGNVLLWANASFEFLDLITSLVDSGQLYLEPCPPLVYFIDGLALTFPVAKKPPAKGYKTPHWLPVCLRVAGKNVKGGQKSCQKAS